MSEDRAMSDDRDQVALEQARQNRTTSAQWVLFGSHRRAIERLIIPAAEPPLGDRAAPPRRPTLCVLGAGNCNDLDLKHLVQVFAEVHLVDIDPSALEAAVRRQGVENLPAIKRHTPFDLTAAAPTVSAWAEGPPTASEIDRTIQAISNSPRPDLGHFDVVLSPCVLSQLIEPIRLALDRGRHARYREIRAALRARHLRTMTHLLRPRGRGVLAIDLASSKMEPRLPQAHDDDLPAVMQRLVSDRRIFTGLSPAEIAETVQSDPPLRREVADLRFTKPWLWHMGLRKSFLVYGVLFRRAMGQA